MVLKATAGLTLCCLGIGLSVCTARQSAAAELRLSQAYPPISHSCLPPEHGALEQFEVAIKALEVSPRSFLGIGAMKLLGHGIYRTEGKNTSRVCLPGEMLDRIVSLATRHRQFEPRLVEYQLKLASQFKEPTQYIVDAVAKSAFNSSMQPSEAPALEDIRPLARAVLAGFGEKAFAYADIAFGQMSADNSLGTGAAQVAVAAGHPLALGRVEQLMHEVLSAIPRSQAVPWEQKNRLYELSYALTLGREASVPHLAPVRDLLSRKVQSFAPPFGMVELKPKRLCLIFKASQPRLQFDLDNYDLCFDEKVPLDN
jgi:hypothetical protein